MTTEQTTFWQRMRENWGRMAYSGVVAGLAGGFLMYRMSQPKAAAIMLAWTCGLLIALPILNVVLVLVEEVRRRDWVFAGLAVAVLAIIGFTILTR
jgi:hypothetical protein